MTIYYHDDQTTVYHGDCIEVMRNMPENSVDAIVTDPPYGLGFMGAKWDALPPGKDWAEECLRVLKPGGHLLAFGGTRTWHRLAVAIEDAGFEIRDSVMWLYGSGFPKSHDVSKAIDKTAGAEREVVGIGGKSGKARNSMAGDFAGEWDTTAPATPEAAQWSGWGTALKPANEPIVMARKPFKGTVAANVLEHGTGALNIDACRIDAGGEQYAPKTNSGRNSFLLGGYNTLEELEVAAMNNEVTPDGKNRAQAVLSRFRSWSGREVTQPSGRWPANVILDEHMAGVLDEQSGVSKSPAPYVQQSKSVGIYGAEKHHDRPSTHHGDSGGASRFFYVAKAPKRERPEVNGVKHATVKPLTLMRYLVRMVTPPNGIVLDPFAGSGTTIEAALLEGFQSIGIELTDEYLPLIQQRVKRQGVGAAMSTKYHVCDHPRLLVKDEVCFLCDQIDGQVDAFDHIDEVGR